MSSHHPNLGVAPAPVDDATLAAARSGDATALEAVLEAVQGQIYRFGLRMCADQQDAEDVTQDTLLQVARRLADFRGDAALSSWLFTIARRACLRHRRRPAGSPLHNLPLDALDQRPDDRQGERLAVPVADANPEQDAVAAELRRAFESGVAALAPMYREVLLLRDVEGLTAPEVAAVVGVGVATVKTRLHRARLALREHLLPYLGPRAVLAVDPLVAIDRSAANGADDANASSTGRSSLPNRTRAPGCPDLPALFSRYLEGELAAHDCAEIERHLDGCASCRGRCEGLKSTLRLCRTLPTPSVPPALAAAVRRSLRLARPHSLPAGQPLAS